MKSTHYDENFAEWGKIRIATIRPFWLVLGGTNRKCRPCWWETNTQCTMLGK